MGFNKSFGSLFSAGASSPIKPYIPTPKVIIGHVLDVCLNKSSPLYDENFGDQCIGSISARDVYGPAIQEVGAEKGVTAYPLDRSSLKIPLPGEQVVIYKAFSDSLASKGGNVPVYYYGSTINNTANITTNSSPFIGISPWLLNPLNFSGWTTEQMARRFDKKIDNIKMFKKLNSDPVIHKQVTPFEGDFILQGRWGNSIRLGATPEDRNADLMPWAEKKMGKPGDPIIIMRVTNETVTLKDATKKMFDTEDINIDGASIYITSGQEIPIDLAIPAADGLLHPLASWAATYDISDSTMSPSTSNLYDGEKTVGKKDGAAGSTDTGAGDGTDLKSNKNNVKGDETDVKDGDEIIGTPNSDTAIGNAILEGGADGGADGGDNGGADDNAGSNSGTNLIIKL